MTWKVENTNGKQWRIVSPDSRWSMQPTGELSADDAKTICEMATKNAEQYAGLVLLTLRADRMRFAQKIYAAEKTDKNAIALAVATIEFDQTRKVQGAIAPFDLIAHLDRQRAFSLKTFGPGPHTKGVIDHIRKELVEIEADPTDLEEWVDLILLAFDGAWRAGFEPQQIIEGIDAKQTKNEGRDWPDWRTADPDKAIEHVRSAE